jgi:hypothetical protein
MRLVQHLGASQGEASSSSKTMWINKLKSEGHRPVMILLDKVHESEATRVEKEWIEHYMTLGVNLFNEKGHGGLRKRLR